MKITRQLYDFLVEMYALEQFIENCDGIRAVQTNIGGAFSWTDTPEGHSFWQGLEHEFDKRTRDNCVEVDEKGNIIK